MTVGLLQLLQNRLRITFLAFTSHKQHRDTALSANGASDPKKLCAHLNMCTHIIKLMANITISIPEELHRKMKRYSEVKWSEVIRKALTDYVGRLEIVEGGVVPSEKLATMLKDSNLDVACVDLEKAVENYEKGRKLEWKRLSTTQTS
jgi:hypothetical protein